MKAFKFYPFIIMIVIFTLAQSVGNSQAQQAKISFTGFTLNITPNKILIDWAIDNTTPTNYFEIQRSDDGINFHTIELVLGPDPTKAGCNCFEGFDKPAPHALKYFYRIKHVSTEGVVELSEPKLMVVNI